MRNVILNRNPTTWRNTDTRLTPHAFYDPTLNQKIAIREMGGEEAFNDFADHLWNMEESEHEKGMGDAILELGPLIRGHRMGIISAGNPKISCSLSDKIAKTLIYGNQRKSDDI